MAGVSGAGFYLVMDALKVPDIYVLFLNLLLYIII